MSLDSTPAAPRKGAGLAFAYVTSLFFAWGFATSLIDPLIAAVRRVFDLSFTEAFLTTFAWFIAYGVASLPAAAVLSKLGYSRAIIAALATMVAGCLIVPVATTVPPPEPPSGPMSTTQSAHLMTSRLCSITMTVLPLSTRACRTCSSLEMSSKCSPVVGSSST